ncbi:LytR/AlgR family response regulator transcription factor [Mangrovivirga cuniculi]|uniref:DNA-binding response regulator n=1 Tax=Mangrovivirga cuniculi TaxID=2715131 RepID=A0A4D7JL89_9BACT|nr:LytTR family DNA-binding domain-containing protein [Mangrovivirga cuniculi]QCK16371.1 DNA-binding response regulator [Mangrovivirga cuniculi]
MIKVLIVEDEKPATDILKYYLDNYDDIELIGAVSDGFSGIKSIKDLNPDLVFLDIHMPRLNGLEMLELLDEPPQVIFITAYDQYAVKAFELEAIDYLLKPIEEERLSSAIERARNKINSGEKADYSKLSKRMIGDENEFLNRIAVKQGSKVHVFPIEEIICFTADDDYVNIIHSSGKFLKQTTLKYLEGVLPPDQFYRIHRSSLVNADFIERIEPLEKQQYVLITKNGERLGVSKNGYSLLREKLGL